MFIVARSRTTTKRSVDILGLSTEFESNYLSEIMPGISVLTIRFGYFGFICWAISKGVNTKSDDFRLLEDALAKTEYNVHSTKRYKGVRNIGSGSVPPYYLQSIFSDYRNTMEGMEVISKNNELTTLGKNFAKLFESKSNVKIPRNLDLAARNGFDGIRKSILKLSSDEKLAYSDLFYKGSHKSSDSKENAKKRKKHKPLYEKLLMRYESSSEVEDSSDINIINLLYSETKKVKKYALAHDMSKYLYLSYNCMKALHELYMILKRQGKASKIKIADAINKNSVRESLDEIMKNKNQQWLRKTKELFNLCRSHDHNSLLTKLIERNRSKKEDKSWFLNTGSDSIRINPNEPTVPKGISSFGIRLAPFESLMGDLSGVLWEE
jgi:hypothetical protein